MIKVLPMQTNQRQSIVIGRQLSVGSEEKFDSIFLVISIDIFRDFRLSTVLRRKFIPLFVESLILNMQPGTATDMRPDELAHQV